MSPRYKSKKIGGRSYLVHRLVMEAHLGRKLRTDEHVHHINEDRFDNRIENLELLSAAEHIHHHKQKYALTKECAACGATFTPHPTKRKRARSCSPSCSHKLKTGRPKKSPQLSHAMVSANVGREAVRDVA